MGKVLLFTVGIGRRDKSIRRFTDSGGNAGVSAHTDALHTLLRTLCFRLPAHVEMGGRTYVRASRALRWM